MSGLSRQERCSELRHLSNRYRQPLTLTSGRSRRECDAPAEGRTSLDAPELAASEDQWGQPNQKYPVPQASRRPVQISIVQVGRAGRCSWLVDAQLGASLRLGGLRHRCSGAGSIFSMTTPPQGSSRLHESERVAIATLRNLRAIRSRVRYMGSYKRSQWVARRLDQCSGQSRDTLALSQSSTQEKRIRAFRNRKQPIVVCCLDSS